MERILESSGYEIEPKSTFDAIVVLGAGIKEKQGRLEPGVAGKMRVISAAEALRGGLARILVLAGGRTKGSAYPSEAWVMKDFLTRRYTREEEKFSKIPPQSIILEEDSVDTSSTFENVLRLARENGWQRVAVLSSEYHLPRARQLAKNLGLVAKTISAENKLKERDRRFEAAINSYYNSNEIATFRIREKLLGFLLLFDPKARIPRTIALITRR